MRFLVNKQDKTPTYNHRLALWMSAFERESTSSGQLQLSSYICVLERNPIAGRTLSVVQTCC